MSEPARVSFVVYGIAAPGGSKTSGTTKDGRRFVRDSSRRAAPWKRDVAQVAGKLMGEQPLLEGPLGLVVTFYLPRPKSHYGARGLKPSAPPWPIVRPDTTKLLRPLEDALTGIVWRDDSQVVVQEAGRVYGEPARCEVFVSELEARG